jgi:IS5 family transposase
VPQVATYDAEQVMAWAREHRATFPTLITETLNTTVLAKLIDADAVRLESGKTVHADKGYDAKATRELLKAQGLRDGVARKDDAQRYDQTDNQKRNKRLSRIRARVEHVFGGWENTMGKRLRSIGETRAKSMIVVQATVYNLRRWITLDARIDGRGASTA